jgi:hypothetical protein
MPFKDVERRREYHRIKMSERRRAQGSRPRRHGADLVRKRQRDRRWVEYQKDWLHTMLGNRCAWCDRTNQEVKLEVDHIIPAFRFGESRPGAKQSYGGNKCLIDYLHGEPLRLLCEDCHKVRHII